MLKLELRCQRVAAYVTGWRSADNSVPSSPATEVDYLIKVQVIVFCRLRSVCWTKAITMNQKLKNVFRLPAFLPTCMLYGAFCLSMARCSNNKCPKCCCLLLSRL